jgi:hypothetical protein
MKINLDDITVSRSKGKRIIRLLDNRNSKLGDKSLDFEFCKLFTPKTVDHIKNGQRRSFQAYSCLIKVDGEECFLTLTKTMYDFLVAGKVLNGELVRAKSSMYSYVDNKGIKHQINGVKFYLERNKGNYLDSNIDTSKSTKKKYEDPEMIDVDLEELL